jgi:hypothetical protein
MSKNQLLNITKEEILFRNISGEEESIKLIKIDDVNISSSVDYPLKKYRVIKNILSLAFCILIVWNYSSNYVDKKIENTSGYGYYGYPWVGEKYQPGGKGSSLYTVDVRRDGMYYNDRISFYVFAFLLVFIFVFPILYLNKKISKYQHNYKTNLHTITISPKEHSQRLVNRSEKVITVGDYETTKENYLKLKSFLKGSSFA